jgi:hypothetical protein
LNLSDLGIRPIIYPFEMGMAIPEVPDDTKDLRKDNWLEVALPFDVFLANSYRFRKLVNYLFRELSEIVKISRKHRARDALKTILINLWLGRLIDKPVRYSRNKNFYTRDRRYGKLFFKYDILLPLIDGLERLGYIKQKTGIYVIEKQFGRQTRMWGTPKLWVLFEYHSILGGDFIDVPGPEELIILRDNSKYKKEIGYRESPLTQRQREDLERYNRFIDDHTITVNLNAHSDVSNRFLTEYLYTNILTNRIHLQQVILNTNPIIAKSNLLPVPLFNNNPYILQTYLPISDIPFYLLPSMTNTDSHKPKVVADLHEFDKAYQKFMNFLYELSTDVATVDSQAESEIVLNEKFPLRQIGVEQLVFRLASEYLHRVYNRKSFDLGGRAYGALHQTLPKQMRRNIRIDGLETVELDFSAYHILMLYHKEGIDYSGDPYLVCGGESFRDTFKIVALVAINAPNERSAYGAIRQELNSRGIPLPDTEKPLVYLVNSFRQTHKPIAKYLFSDVGLELQKIDSDIMNVILMRLMDHGILGLSVYDSVIVAEGHEQILREIMIKEYEKVMKFKPKL